MNGIFRQHWRGVDGVFADLFPWLSRDADIVRGQEFVVFNLAPGISVVWEDRRPGSRVFMAFADKSPVRKRPEPLILPALVDERDEQETVGALSAWAAEIKMLDWAHEEVFDPFKADRTVLSAPSPNWLPPSNFFVGNIVLASPSRRALRRVRPTDGWTACNPDFFRDFDFYLVEKGSCERTIAWNMGPTMQRIPWGPAT